MQYKQLNELISKLETQLLSRQNSEEALWRGQLSSSAISTAVSTYALFSIDKDLYKSHISGGVEWLKKTMLSDGTWGDSIESPSNLTATLLSYTALYAIGEAPVVSEKFLEKKFGGLSSQHIIDGVLSYYGKDLTFSVPILVMCALAGLINNWNKIPQLPFELSIMPQKFYKLLNLPVVSYAIPALIAVGILRFKRGGRGLISRVRNLFIPKSITVLSNLQPSNGGFLEAAPLTGFVSMCMAHAGYKDHKTTKLAADFLTGTVRADGSWPIDTDLSTWVTILCVRALGDTVKNKQALAQTIKGNQFKQKHYFTGAVAGGWGWSDLPGAAPDADDTSGSLVALHSLQNGIYSPEIANGLQWLMKLQNKDGGIPTFCKGWGKLPFDRSSPDITAHSLLAFSLWHDTLPVPMQEKCKKSVSRMLKWMQKIQADNGSWEPLWFGDQNSPNESNPVYATAISIEYLQMVNNQVATDMSLRGVDFLLKNQNDDGGWGGQKGAPSKVTLTARALSALICYAENKQNNILESIDRAYNFILKADRNNTLLEREPIGLYFSRLWYSEQEYSICFVLNALKKYRIFIKTINFDRNS